MPPGPGRRAATVPARSGVAFSHGVQAGGFAGRPRRGLELVAVEARQQAMVFTSIDCDRCLGKALVRTCFPLGAGTTFAGADTARFAMCGVAAAATAHVGRVGVGVLRAV